MLRNFCQRFDNTKVAQHADYGSVKFADKFFITTELAESTKKIFKFSFLRF